MLFLNSRINFKFLTLLNKIHIINYLNFFTFYYLKNFYFYEYKIFSYVLCYKKLWPRNAVPLSFFNNHKLHKFYFKLTNSTFYPNNLSLSINTLILKNNKNWIEKNFVSKFFVFNFFLFFLRTYSFINFFFFNYFSFMFKRPLSNFFSKSQNSHKYSFNFFLRSANIKNLVNFNLHLL